MIWLLLVLYQIKHFVCDYPLQGKYMLGKFKSGNNWILPLLAHSGVHGVATFLITLCFKPKSAFWLALFDMVVHFAMDRIKASPNMLGRYKALSSNEYPSVNSMASQAGSSNPELAMAGKSAVRKLQDNMYFWWALGFDQGVHHLTHYVIIWRLLS